MRPRFFRTQADWRAWLHAHHADKDELWVGFYKKATGKPSITWPQSVDEALCYGWIDGIRKRVDGGAYVIRFTPRRDGSTWSAVNVRRVGELKQLKLMAAAGLAAFAKRTEEKSRIYSYENRATIRFTPAIAKRFRANAAAWKFFRERPPGYRQLMTYYVMSAKREATREQRLVRLIGESAAGRVLR